MATHEREHLDRALEIFSEVKGRFLDLNVPSGRGVEPPDGGVLNPVSIRSGLAWEDRSCCPLGRTGYLPPTKRLLLANGTNGWVLTVGATDV